MRSAVHSGVISHSASSLGFAACKGEMEKDIHAWRCVFLTSGGQLRSFNSLIILKFSVPLLDPPQSVMVFLSVQPSIPSPCAWNG